MSVEFQIDGYEELLQALRNLPNELKNEAASIVNNAAQTAYRQVYDAYPVVTGELRDGLEVMPFESGPYGAAAVLVNNTWYANIYEHGRQAGPHPSKPGNKFIPIVIRARRQMWEQLAVMVRHHGLEVTGSVDVAAA